VNPEDTGSEVQTAMKRVKDLRIRIVVFHASTRLARLMVVQASKQEMLNGDFVVIATRQWAQGTDFSEAVYNDDEKPLMQGFIGIRSYEADSARVAAFNKKLMAHSPV